MGYSTRRVRRRRLDSYDKSNGLTSIRVGYKHGVCRTCANSNNTISKRIPSADRQRPAVLLCHVEVAVPFGDKSRPACRHEAEGEEDGERCRCPNSFNDCFHCCDPFSLLLVVVVVEIGLGCGGREWNSRTARPDGGRLALSSSTVHVVSPRTRFVARRKVRARLVPRCRASVRDRGNAKKASSRRVLLEAVGMARIETRIEEANIAPLLSVVYTETSYISSNDRFAAMATELPTAISPTDLIPPHIGLRRRRRRPSQ